MDARSISLEYINASTAPLSETDFHSQNELELHVKLSGEFGTGLEIEYCQSLDEIIADLGGDCDGTLAGNGYYVIYVKSDDPLKLFTRLKPQLQTMKIPVGSFAESIVLSGNFRDRQILEFS